MFLSACIDKTASFSVICRTSFLLLTVMHFLHVSAQSIEGEAINIIDQSFKTLRSSAAAFDMLLKFKHIRSREAINNHLMRKFNDILAQYCKEVLYCEIKRKFWLMLL